MLTRFLPYTSVREIGAPFSHPWTPARDGDPGNLSSEDVSVASTNVRVDSVPVPHGCRIDRGTAARPHAIYRRRTAISAAGRFFASRRINVVAFGGGDEKPGSIYLYSARTPPVHRIISLPVIPPSTAGRRFLLDAPGRSVPDTIIRAPIIKTFPFEVDARATSRYEARVSATAARKKLIVMHRVGN